MTSPPLARMVPGLVVLSTILVALVCFQYLEVKQIREDSYERCLATSRSAAKGATARRVEIEEFRALGALARVNAGIPYEQQVARQESYNRMAAALQDAVDAVVPIEDCERFT